MEVMVVNDIPDVAAETHERRILAAAALESDPPDDLIIHGAGAIPAAGAC